jgi:PAS domain S-box-containing protein
MQSPQSESLSSDFGMMLDAAPVLIAGADRFGRVVLFNTACETLTGFLRHEVLGEPFIETLVPPDWHDVVRGRFAGDSPAALAAPHVNPWRTRNGQSREIEWHCFSVSDDAWPNAPWIIGFGHDISTLADARQTIQTQQSVLDALLDQIPEGITIADAPGVTIRRVSRFGERITGRSRTALENISADEHPQAWALFRPDGAAAAPDELPLTRATQHGELVTDEEWVMKRPDGSEVTILCNAAPIRNAAGHITGGLVAWHDITERKRLEAELRATNQAKDEFLAAIAHELRQPLAASLVASSMLRAHRDSPEQMEHAHAVLDRQLKQMTRLIDDVLDAGHVARGKVTLAKQRLDLREAVRRACESSSGVMESRQHSLSVQVAEAPTFVDADPIRLQQVLVNLLGNAAKYTPHGGTITVQVTCDDTVARVSVRDNGRGIPKEAQARIFELFARADTEADGFGIGLAVVSRLVTAHGGSVSVTSEGTGCGSEFTVTLPRVR